MFCAIQEKFVLAFDFGTSGVKAVLVSLEGSVITSQLARYPLFVPNSGYAEQNPEDYWKALISSVQGVVKSGYSLSNIVAISLCTQWKGIIPIDANGKVLNNNIIWSDTRATKEAIILNKKMNTSRFTAQSYHARLLWLKRNLPDIYEETKVFLEVNSFIKWKLTGELSMDISNNFIHSFDPETEKFFHKALSIENFDENKFPNLTESTQEIGRVTVKAFSETGIPNGTPVFSGTTDIAAVAIGSGCSVPGAVHAYFGTSGWIAGISPHVHENIFSVMASLDKNRDVMVYELQSVGMALNWTIHQLYRYEESEYKNEIFTFIDEQVSKVKPGSEGLIATPWLAGETPPLSDKARTVFLNISSYHDRKHIVRAVMEGVCFSMKMRLNEFINCNSAQNIGCLKAVGGGANSNPWMQMLSDILEIPVSVPMGNQDSGALGAAVCALVGLGCFNNFEEACNSLKTKKVFYPNSSNFNIYSSMFKIYSSLFDKIKGVLSDLQAI